MILLAIFLQSLIIYLLLEFATNKGRKFRYQEAQIRLLMHIAAANNVNKDKIAEIVAEAKLPEFKK